MCKCEELYDMSNKKQSDSGQKVSYVFIAHFEVPTILLLPKF